MADERMPIEILIDAKLSGTNAILDDGEWGYRFRTNEQAAHLAVEVLVEAGYELIRRGDS